MEEDGHRLKLGGNPDWMSSLPDELLDVPLWNLALPGKDKPGSSGLKPQIIRFLCMLKSSNCLQGVMTACLSVWTCPLRC